MVWLWRCHLPPTFSSILFPSLLQHVKKHCHSFSHIVTHIQKRVTVHFCSVSSFTSLPCNSVLSYSQHPIMVRLLCHSCCHYCLIFFSSRTTNSHPSTPVLNFFLSPLSLFSETRVLKEWGFGLPSHVGFSSEEFWWGSLAGSLCPFPCLSWSVSACLHYKCTTMSHSYCTDKPNAECSKSFWDPGWFTLLGVTQC